VLGQAHTRRRRVLPLAAFALVVLAAPTLGLAGSSQSPASLRADNARIETQSRSAVLQIYSLDQRVASAHARVASLDQQATSLRAERASLEHQLDIARRGDRIAQRQLARRFRMLYEQGNIEPLEILFGAKNLDDAISSLDNLSSMSAQGEDVLQQLSRARKLLTKARQNLERRAAALAAAEAAARATEESLVRTRAARESYVASLATQRRLNDHQIAAFVARAQAAQAKSAQLAPAAAVAVADTRATTADVPAPAPAAGAHSITVTATGYSLPGSTSTGIPVGWGVAAVDPSVIPLGTHMVIPGYGVAVAADTGGSIVGSTIDLWFPTVEQANAWGRRTVTIALQ
jgi:cystine transport system substrate-binding protein